MKTYRFAFLLMLSIGLIAASALGYQTLTASKVMADTNFLAGSWNVTVTVVQQNANFPALVTFTSDGTILTDETPAPLETSGHGTWVKTKSNEAAYTFAFLIGNTDPTQWLKGTVSGSVTYDPKTDQWSGPFTIKIVDQDGNEVLSDTGTMTGTRITAVP